ncbi:hypothetical protein [Paraburkholderia dioscoreae]|uniref:Uncharacterized protein n=1 Tax=Paraburkholderia dioscoreae TaxID=2604047 RepID=A0A5Q4ZE75_9BURK|nr:hypothetical protein [Paraburkholderia dioscoreae]VVD29133.1 conserved protein of unknown function [Paraburkholderia dioscoreae]
MATRPRKNANEWENRAFIQSISGNADQTEWKAVKDGRANLQAGIMDDRIADATEQFVGDDSKDTVFQKSEATYETLTGTLTEEILWRQKVLGKDYPFEIQGGSLVHVPGTSMVYEALLGITQAETLTEGDHTILPRWFERIAVVTAQSYLGPTSVARHTGWPRPWAQKKEFKAVVDLLNELTGKRNGEWQWHPADDRPTSPTTTDVKDGGVDVVAWIPHLDERTGQLYLLGQCACGGDWTTKFDDINIDDLTQWAKISVVPPIRSFFTPYRVATPYMRDASRKAGIVFDRIRIVSVLRKGHRSQIVARLPRVFTRLINVAKLPKPPKAAAAPQPQTSGSA